MKIHFEKMHGCGNDFIIIENLDKRLKLGQEQIAKLCDRHKGIGADGLVLIEKDPIYFMNYYNSDGTPAEMCGNAMRCVGDFIYRNIEPFDSTQVRSRKALHEVKKTDANYTVSLPKADYQKDAIGLDNDFPIQGELIVNNSDCFYGCASMGNPHLVIVLDELSNDIVERYGPLYENTKAFKNKVNVNFVQILDRDLIKVNTWERGCGFTLACGTGSCAAVSVLHKNNFTDNNVQVILPGGELTIEIGKNEIQMTGPAEFVYSGEFEV